VDDITTWALRFLDLLRCFSPLAVLLLSLHLTPCVAFLFGVRKRIYTTVAPFDIFVLFFAFWVRERIHTTITRLT
jgi:hypothetical protein